MTSTVSLFKYPPDFSVTFNQGGLTVRGSDKNYNTYSISVFKGERKIETDSIKEFYLKEGEEDIYVGDTKYTAEILYSAEGMQAPGKPDFMNSIVWTTKYIEINSNTSVHINLMDDNYWDENTNSEVNAEPSIEDIQNGLLLLQSVIFN